jgi:mannan endo-1,4-beta-mannosidase
MIEEWGVTSSPSGQFDQQVSVFNQNGVPWMYWQIIPGADQTQSCSGQCCGTNNGNSYDGFEIGINSSKGNVKSAVAQARSVTALQDWSGFV